MRRRPERGSVGNVVRYRAGGTASLLPAKPTRAGDDVFISLLYPLNFISNFTPKLMTGACKPAGFDKLQDRKQHAA